MEETSSCVPSCSISYSRTRHSSSSLLLVVMILASVITTINGSSSFSAKEMTVLWASTTQTSRQNCRQTFRWQRSWPPWRDGPKTGRSPSDPPYPPSGSWWWFRVLKFPFGLYTPVLVERPASTTRSMTTTTATTRSFLFLSLWSAWS